MRRLLTSVLLLAAAGLALAAPRARAQAAPPFPVVKFPGGAVTSDPTQPGRYFVNAGSVIRWTVSFDNRAGFSDLVLDYTDLIDPTGLSSCAGAACPGTGQLNLMCPLAPDPDAPQTDSGTITCNASTGVVEVLGMTVPRGEIRCLRFSTGVQPTATGQVGNVGCFDVTAPLPGGPYQTYPPQQVNPVCVPPPASGPTPGCSNVLITSTTPPPYTVQKTVNWQDSSGDAQLSLGELVLWTVVVTNETDDPQVGFVFDDVPAGQDWVGFRPLGDLDGACTYDAGARRISCRDVPFDPRQARTLAFDTRVNCDAVTSDDSFRVCNRARACTDAAGLTCIQSDDDLVAPYTATCLELPFTRYEDSTKSWTFDDRNRNGDVDAGDRVTFTLDVRNTGRLDSPNVSLADFLDPSCMVLPPLATGGGFFDAGTNAILWTLGPVPGGGGEARATFTVEVTGAGPCCNQAEIEGAESSTCAGAPTLTDDALTTAPDDPTCVRFGPQPRVTLLKDFTLADDVNASGDLDAGDVVEFTVTARNDGGAPATDVRVSDSMLPCFTGFDPAGVAVTGEGTNASEPPALPAHAGRVVVDGVGGADGLAALGAEVVTVTWRVTVGSMICCNVATATHAELGLAVRSDDPTTGLPGDDTCLVRSPVSVVLQKTAADADGDGCMEAGETVTYTLTATAFGGDVLDAVLVDDVTDPAGRLTVTDPGGGTYAAGPESITWTIGTISPGAPAVVSWTGTLACASANADPISDDAQLTTSNLAPASARWAGTIGKAVLQVQKSPYIIDVNSNGALDAGETIGYSIQVSNVGGCPASNVVLTDQIDPDLDWTALVTSGSPTHDGTGGLRWDGTTSPELVSLDAGGTFVVNASSKALNPLVNPQPGADGLAENSATVAADAEHGCAAPGDTTVAAAVPIQAGAAPRLDVRKSVEDADLDGCLEPGERLSFVIQVEAVGGDAANVQLRDVIDDPNSVLSVGFTSGGAYDAVASRITWDLGTITAGGVVERSWQADIACSAEDGDLIADVATATSPSALSGAANLDSRVNAGRLVIAKTATDASGDGSLAPGEGVHFDVVVTNVGSCAALAVTVSDALDSDLDHAAVVPGSGGVSDGAGGVAWSPGTTPALASIAAGGQVVLGLDAVALDPATNPQLPAPDAVVGNDASAAWRVTSPVACDPSVFPRAASGQLPGAQELPVVAPALQLLRNAAYTCRAQAFATMHARGAVDAVRDLYDSAPSPPRTIAGDAAPVGQTCPQADPPPDTGRVLVVYALTDDAAVLRVAKSGADVVLSW